MRIVLVGINHRTAPVEVREKLAVAGEQVEAALAALRHSFRDIEAVLLSTCNRTELYVARPARHAPGVEDLRAFLADMGGVGADVVTGSSIHREQEQAVHHLFRVCAGLDSMVLGEPQILGQVKRAYELAAACESVGPALHKVFQQGIATAKRVRTATGIDAGRVSIASVAVDFARRIFEDFTDKTIVGVGAGDMAKATLRHLQRLSPSRLWLVNRSPDRAVALAQELGLVAPLGGVRPWEELDELLVEADIILTGTGSREPVLTAQRFRPLMKRRRNRPLFLIDIAVPRDVEPDVAGLRNVYLYNIDDLQSVVSANFQQRRDQVRQCEAQLAADAQRCLRQLQNRDLGQLIRLLRHQFHDIGDIERQRTQRKLASMPAGDDAALARLIDEHTHRVINKILHRPLSRLDHNDPDAPVGFYAAALRRLFQLEDDPTPDTHDAQPPHNSADD